MDYLKLLVHSFNFEHEHGDAIRQSRLMFLSRHIFDFTTCDGVMDELFAAKAVEVCDAITSKKTYEYIECDENYKWFLLMCNMRFFAENISWGTSIRGAWWKPQLHKLASCGLWNEFEQVEKLEFNAEQWVEFIESVIEFSKGV